MSGPVCRTVLALLHLDQSDLIDQAVRGHRVAVARHAHVAHDVAAAGDRPALEFLRLRVEAHDRVRLGAGFVVPERALGEDDAVGLRLRSARRWPFLVLAGRKIEPPEIAAREIRVPDRVVGRERKTARTRCRVRQSVFLDRHGVGIDGRDLGVGEVTSLTSPLLGSMRPTMLAFWAVNHTMPLPSTAMVWGSFAFGSGILYSVTSPVLGSSLPTRLMWLPVNQMLPSLSSTRPCGRVCGVWSGYCLISPLSGSRRPSLPESCPVYQIAPSLVASGSCGREPGVGTCHSLIAASTGPAMMTAAGRGRSGKLAIKYCVSGSISSLGTGTPKLSIMRITVRQPSGV